jgi:hypothetical protein
MIKNSRMDALHPDVCSDLSRRALPEELESILASGWIKGVGGALLLSAVGRHLAAREVPYDRLGGFEYEVNDLHIPDRDLSSDVGEFLPRLSSRALTFAISGLEMSRTLEGSDKLIAVVGVGVGEDFITHGATVKFFTKRGDYPRWFEDLERFEDEAMAVLTMADTSGQP